MKALDNPGIKTRAGAITRQNLVILVAGAEKEQEISSATA